MKLSTREEAIRRHKLDIQDAESRASHPKTKVAKSHKMLRDIRRMGRH